MHLVENRREVSHNEVLNYIEPILTRINRDVKPDILLRSWQERSGIFKGEGDAYFFHHLSFQEYLVAEEIRNTGKQDILVKNFDNAWWREPTLLAMGLTNPSIFSAFMQSLLAQSTGDGGGSEFMLRCVDEAIEKFEDPFIEVIKTSKNFDARYRSLLALERMKTEKAKAGVLRFRAYRTERGRKLRGVLSTFASSFLLEENDQWLRTQMQRV